MHGYKIERSRPGLPRLVDHGEEENIGKYKVQGIRHVMSMRKGNKKVDIVLSD